MFTMCTKTHQSNRRIRVARAKFRSQCCINQNIGRSNNSVSTEATIKNNYLQNVTNCSIMNKAQM